MVSPVYLRTTSVEAGDVGQSSAKGVPIRRCIAVSNPSSHYALGSADAEHERLIHKHPFGEA
jgi:hypothetical protein